ncbi:hypothetical protein B0H12DRAFT_1117396 [Mycena haematopus]|nr:hypothetical protein B0H12DRAFT_1117396 [Mycena haematopus]
MIPAPLPTFISNSASSLQRPQKFHSIFLGAKLAGWNSSFMFTRGFRHAKIYSIGYLPHSKSLSHMGADIDCYRLYDNCFSSG